MVATQQMLALAVASTAIILQGCDDGPGPFDSQKHNPFDSNFGPRHPSGFKPDAWPRPRHLSGLKPSPPGQPGPAPVGKPGKGGKGKDKDSKGKTIKIPSGAPPKPNPSKFTLDLANGKNKPNADKLYKNVKSAFDNRLKFKTGFGDDGAGGFGAVHLAEVKCQAGNRKTIVKVPTLANCQGMWDARAQAQCFEDAQKEGQHEVAMLKKVHGSPYFSQLYAAVESREKITSIMMEALRGDLLKLKREVRDARVEDKLNWSMQLLRGIKVLHDQGLMHHDLKAQNVMLSDNDELRIIDLGAACPVGRGVEGRCDLGAHTPGWVPTEYYEYYFNKNHYKHWANRTPEDMKKMDIYAAGLIIFNMFAEKDMDSWTPDRYKYTLPGTRAFTWVNLDNDNAHRHFQILQGYQKRKYAPVRDWLNKLLVKDVSRRDNIDQAIAGLESAMSGVGAVEKKITMDASRYAPKCLKQCLDDGCSKTCFIGNNGFNGRIDAGGNKQCLPVADGVVLPKVRENHFGEEL